MKRNIILSFFMFLYFCAGVAHCAEEKKDLSRYPTAEELQKASQSAVKPILPPVIPVVPSAVSPIPSPHIAAPIILPQTINPTIQVRPQFFQPPMMQNMPSMPTQVNVPNVPMPIEISQVPVIGNAVGKVVNVGIDGNGIPWLEVNDDLFGEVIKIKIKNLKNTPIVKEARIYDFKNIKIGDTVNAMFRTEGDDNAASFINVMSEEEIEMMKGVAKPQESTVTSEDASKETSPGQPEKPDNRDSASE